MEDFLDFIRRNKWKILLVALGVLFTILVFTINFWRTLLLFFIVGVCYIIGSLLDEGGRQRLADFFSRLFHKGS